LASKNAKKSGRFQKIFVVTKQYISILAPNANNVCSPENHVLSPRFPFEKICDQLPVLHKIRYVVPSLKMAFFCHTEKYYKLIKTAYYAFNNVIIILIY